MRSQRSSNAALRALSAADGSMGRSQARKDSDEQKCEPPRRRPHCGSDRRGRRDRGLPRPRGRGRDILGDPDADDRRHEHFATRSGVVEVIASERAADSPFPGGGSGEATAQGSGFVYDSTGRVITNQHVVDGATSVSVRFASGQTVHAEIVGTDPSTDVAVLKVDALPSSAKPLALGDSDAVEVGDGVVAIGSPFGLTGTVTSGIVSALGREIDSPNNYAIEGAIQTDAAINHGNSGGPLFDMHGRVIGVNAQIKSDSGGNDGVGFAIPSSTIRSIATRLIQNGSVQHAYLGVSLDTADSGGAHISTVT